MPTQPISAPPGPPVPAQPIPALHPAGPVLDRPSPDQPSATPLPVRLKWHKLRYRASDPPFQRHNLIAALAAGQPCEVDLRFTADHHALCLHDADLRTETTGSGPVAAARRIDVERLRQRGNEGQVLDTGPLFLDEVVAAVRAHGAVGPGLVQLDVKTPVPALHPEALAGFGRLLGAAAPAFIASGYAGELISRLCAAAPGLHAGFDPLALYRRPQQLTARQLQAVAEAALAQAPGAAIYYLEARLVLAGLDRGFDLVAAVTAGGTSGALVDAWTIDPSRPQLATVLRRLLAAGVGQITTNDPATLAGVIARL